MILVFLVATKVDMDCLLSCYSKFNQSSQRFGVHGFNINVCNATAAVFMATGQDIACLTDSNSAFFHLLPVNDISQRSEALESKFINVMIINISDNVSNKDIDHDREKGK